MEFSNAENLYFNSGGLVHLSISDENKCTNSVSQRLKANIRAVFFYLNTHYHSTHTYAHRGTDSSILHTFSERRKIDIVV